MSLKKIASALYFFIFYFALATPAQAGLIGDTIFATGSSLSPSSAVVDTAIEFSAVNSYLNFDFSDSHLTITSTTGVGWGNFGNFVFSGFNEDITDVFIFSNDGFTGGIVDNFSFDATKISLDMNTGRSGRSLIFQINTAVPEPSSLAILFLGLMCIRLARKKQNS